MARVSPLTAARVLAGGRVVVGLALTVAPGSAGRGWLGDAVDTPGGEVAVRALGIRDLVVGALTLHTLSSAQVGPRMLATGGVCDVVDFAATVAVRDRLPKSAFGAIAVAGGAAVASFGLAAALKRGA